MAEDRHTVTKSSLPIQIKEARIKLSSRTNDYGKNYRHSISSTSSQESPLQPKTAKIAGEPSCGSKNNDESPLNQPGTVDNTFFDSKAFHLVIEQAVQTAVAGIKQTLLSYVKDQFLVFDERLSEVELTQRSIGLDVDNFHERFEQMEASMKAKESECKSLANKLNNNLEQYTRKAHLRVFGVKETPNEDCVKIVSKLIKDKVKIDKSISIEAAHRVGPLPNVSSDDTTPKTVKPRGIIVRFMRRDERQLVVSNRRKLAKSGVSIVEDMTVENIRLLDKLQKHPLVKSSWFSNGKVKAQGHNNNVCRVELVPELDDQLIRKLSDQKLSDGNLQMLWLFSKKVTQMNAAITDPFRSLVLL
ncbi:uncharacterized protein LOC130014375 [Patella vulgata]|uniref:uncharacterized protein LOC130014375 n=1 Tax=Patella vulgata TaxID=6465 RepID=UPI0024A8B2A6|nr:uncharacterized protein LOC130014375 [Patella vulgata]